MRSNTSLSSASPVSGSTPACLPSCARMIGCCISYSPAVAALSPSGASNERPVRQPSERRFGDRTPPSGRHAPHAFGVHRGRRRGRRGNSCKAPQTAQVARSRGWTTVGAILVAGLLAGCGSTTSTTNSDTTQAQPAPVVHRHHKHRAVPREPANATTTDTTTTPAPTTQAAPPPAASESVGSSSHAGDAQFCTAHQCIGNFQGEGGTIVQCSDGTYSHAGGISGSCSHHGGER